MGSWSCWLWYQHPSPLLTLLTTQDSVFLLEGLHNNCRKQNQGREVISCHLIWLLSIKLGLWSFQLWYQHPSWLLTLFTKQDSVFLLEGLHNHCKKQNQGGEVMPCYFIWMLSIKLGSWSCHLGYQHPLWVLTLLTKRDSAYCWMSFVIVVGNRMKGGGVLPFHLIAQH